MSIDHLTTQGRIAGQASAGVRLASLSDISLLWELGMLHAARAAGSETLDDAERVVDLEGEYLRRHPVQETVTH